MNFDKAYKELLIGKKIRRKEWDALVHLKMVDDKVIAFKGEYSSHYQSPNILISGGWKEVDGDDDSLNFIEVIELLKLKKCVTRDDWGDKFLFVDKNQLATCRPVEFEFMPTWVCLNAVDWEIMK